MTYAALTLWAFLFYFLAAICHGAALFLSASAAPAATPPYGFRVARLGRPLLWAGIALQFAAIGVWCVEFRRSPFARPAGTLAVTAWAIALAYGLLDFRTRVPAVGAISLLISCLALFGSVLKTGAPLAETPILRDRIVSLHVLAILGSFGLLAVAFGSALLYLLQNRLLREHHVPKLFRRIPPLATLDAIAYRAVAFALPLLTLGIALGIARIFGGDLGSHPTAWLLDPHALASFMAWLLYVGYIVARWLAGWRGVRLQYILIVGMALTIALSFLPSSTHRFH
jgi:ABC-type uncharacterized transport system permease subunit